MLGLNFASAFLRTTHAAFGTDSTTRHSACDRPTGDILDQRWITRYSDNDGKGAAQPTRRGKARMRLPAGASRLRPSHTTVRTGPYTAVREVALTHFDQGGETA